MILVKVTAEKDGIPVEYSFEAQPDTAISESLALIEALKEQGFKAPAKPQYSRKGGKSQKPNAIDYDSDKKLLTINIAYIADESKRNAFNEQFKAAFKEATARFIWFNVDEKQWQYPPPNNAQAKPLSATDLLALEDNEFFKDFERGDGFKKAIESIKEYIALKEKEKQSEGNPF